MYRYIALLRGINVSGKNKLLMKDLKVLLDRWKYKSVQTYIQSGNIVFEREEKLPPKVLATDIHRLLEDTFGYDIPVMVFEQDYWVETVENNPFLESNEDLDIKYLHVTFLEEEPARDLLPKVLEADTGTEQLRLAKDKLYLYYPDGYGRAKMTNNKIEIKLKVTATTRNWKTCKKLYEMVQA